MKRVPVDIEIFTMVVIIRRIVAGTCFFWNVGIGSRSLCLLGESYIRLSILLIDAGGNDDTTLGITNRMGWKEVA